MWYSRFAAENIVSSVQSTEQQGHMFPSIFLLKWQSAPLSLLVVDTIYYNIFIVLYVRVAE